MKKHVLHCFSVNYRIESRKKATIFLFKIKPFHGFQSKKTMQYKLLPKIKNHFEFLHASGQLWHGYCKSDVIPEKSPELECYQDKNSPTAM